MNSNKTTPVFYLADNYERFYRVPVHSWQYHVSNALERFIKRFRDVLFRPFIVPESEWDEGTRSLVAHHRERVAKDKEQSA